MRKKSDKLIFILAAVILTTILLSGIFAPWLTPFNPFQPDIANRLEPPNIVHWFGTDALGRDIFSRMLYGSRSTILLSFISTLIALSLGTVVGLVGGYYGGRIDNMLTMVSSIFQGIPGTCFMIAIAGFAGPGLSGLLLALVIGSWAGFSRIVRSEVMRIRQAGFVEGLRAIGAGDTRIIALHILPHLFSSLLILGSLRLGRGVLSIAGLSFLGLGVQPPAPDWSVMISDAMLYYRSSPHLVIIPGLAVWLLVSSINAIGHFLRDYFDVRLEEVKS